MCYSVGASTLSNGNNAAYVVRFDNAIPDQSECPLFPLHNPQLLQDAITLCLSFLSLNFTHFPHQACTRTSPSPPLTAELLLKRGSDRLSSTLTLHSSHAWSQGKPAQHPTERPTLPRGLGCLMLHVFTCSPLVGTINITHHYLSFSKSGASACV